MVFNLVSGHRNLGCFVCGAHYKSPAHMREWPWCSKTATISGGRDMDEREREIDRERGGGGEGGRESGREKRGGKGQVW